MATQALPSPRPLDEAAPIATAQGGTRPAAPAGLTRRDFFADVVDRLRAGLPEHLAGFRHRSTMNLLKVYYGNERVHYEVWTDGQRAQIEVGLHFEDGPLSTAAYLAYFDARIVELKHELGPQLELERWTASWGHLYELTPLTRLDDRVVERVARRLAALIATLQPLVEEADVPPERGSVPGPERRGPWRKWRRGRG